MAEGLYPALAPLVQAGRLREAAAALQRLTREGASPWEAYLWKGRIEEKLGRPQEAEQAYRKALRAGPGSGAPEMEFARFLEERGRLEEAQRQLLRALELGGPACEALLDLGRLREKQGLAEAARQAYRRAAAADPGSPLPQIALSRLLAKAGRLTQAEAGLRRALKSAGRSSEARLLLGTLYVRSGRLRAAETQLRQAARADPGDAQAFLELARLLDKTGRPARALAAFRKAAVAACACSQPLNDWPEIFSALLCGGAYQAAFRLGEAMLHRSPRMANPNSFLWPWWYRVSSRWSADKERFCIRELARLRRTAAGESPHWYAYIRGVLAISLSRDQDVRTEFESLRRRPLERYACLLHPFVMRELLGGRYAETIAVCRAVLREVPEYWWFQCRLAEALLAQGRSAAGLREFERARRSDDLRVRQAVMTWHGEALLWLGEYRRALALLDQAAALGATTWVDCWRGAARLKLGQPRRALADLDRAVARDPQDLEAFAWRGEAHRLLGRPAQALRDLDRAIALDAKYGWALCSRALARQALGDAAGMAADFAALPPAMSAFLRRRLGLPPAPSPARMGRALRTALELARGLRRPEAYLDPVWMGRASPTSAVRPKKS